MIACTSLARYNNIAYGNLVIAAPQKVKQLFTLHTCTRSLLLTFWCHGVQYSHGPLVWPPRSPDLTLQTTGEYLLHPTMKPRGTSCGMILKRLG